MLSLNPSGVVLLMGTNDLEEGAEPETIAGNLELIIAALKKHDAEMPIVLCQVYPSSATKKRSADKIKEINQRYAEAVKGDPQVTVVDTWTLFANAEGDAKKEEFPDVLHPNALGYAKWAAALRPILATLGYLDNESELTGFRPGLLGASPDRNHRSHDVVLGQVDELGRFLDVEADHRAGVLAHVLGGQHQGLHRHADRALGLVTLKPVPAFVRRSHPVDQEIGGFLRGVAPVALRFRGPGLDIAGHEDEQGGVRHLGLVVAESIPDFLAQLRVTQDHESPVLDVETGG